MIYKHFKKGYYVSDSGKVIRIRNNKKVKVDIYENKHTYLWFIIYSKAGKEKVYLHRAVALVFIPKIKGKYIVDHKNRNRQDNRACNLRWVNHKENMMNK